VAEGVPLNDGFGGWVTWSRLPDVAIDSVDAQRGPQGEAFGSDALGGVIRITPANGRARSFRFDGEAGSFGTGSLDLAAGGRSHGVAFFGAASWFDTNGTIPLEPASQGPVDQPTDTHWANGFGRVEIGKSKRHLTFAGWGGSERRGNGTVLQRNDSSGGTFTTSFDSAMKEFTVAARLAVTPNHFYQTFTTVAAGRATETLTQAQTIDATTTRAVFEVSHQIPMKGLVMARAGLNRAHADFDVATATATTTQVLRDDSQAVSVQADVAPWSSRLAIGGGIRHEWRAAPTSADANKGATVGRLTASLSQQGPFTFRGSIATSHRWPTLNELVRGFQAGSVITNPNPDLKPERAVSFDGAAVLQRGRTQVSVGGYHAVVNDAIANVTLSSGKTIIRQRQNAGEAHATGLEVDGDQRLGSHLVVRGSLTVVNARFVNSLEAALEGNKLPQIPKVSGALDVAVTLPHGIGGSVVWHDVSSQFDDDRNTFLLARASQVDARVTGRVKHVGWMVTGENLFDSRIEVGKTPLVTLAPGRAARAGISLRW
jgi:outer membrane receptor protein involved in Fe transport